MMNICPLSAALRRAIVISTSKHLSPSPRLQIPSRRYSSLPPLNYTYQEVISLLSTLQSNRAIRATLSDATNTPNRNKDAIPEMLEWFRKAGYAPEDIAKKGMRCIHVAGSSGKGSVCAMVESILMQYRGEGLAGSIGTFTSPHLVDVRERIKINGQPIGKTDFIRQFQELWSAFAEDKNTNNSLELRPGYFRFLTILALKIFMKKGVKTAIVECGIGGEYDSTNILPSEAVSVCAITRLELDHVEMLGGTIEEIAWHKGGIIKQDVPLFTALQPPTALAVIQERANEKNSNVTVVERLPSLSSGDIKLGLIGDFQKDNASLAVSVAAAHLQGLNVPQSFPVHTELLNDHAALPPKFVTGLETVKWPGRCEIYKHNDVEYCIDGSHTNEGMQAVGTWFGSHLIEAFKKNDTPETIVLIFNQSERDGKPLLQSLLYSIKRELAQAFMTSESKVSNPRWAESINRYQAFSIGAFCPNQAFPDDDFKNIESRDLSKQTYLMDAYGEMDRNNFVAVYGSVREAIDVAENFAFKDQGDGEVRRRKVLVLVTGSLHLVGAWLQNVPERSRGTGFIKNFIALPSNARQGRGQPAQHDVSVEIVDSPTLRGVRYK